MSQQRPMIVRQKEDYDEYGRGHYWFTVGGGNGETVLTSKMYRERWRAIRAARAFIAQVGLAVTFRYWTGPTPEQWFTACERGLSCGTNRVVAERINQ